MSASKYRLDVEKSSGGASSTIHLGGESGNTSGGGEDPDRGLGLGAVNEVSSGGIAARRGSGALKRKEDPKASPNPSLRKDQSDVVNALWANVLPKMTVLVVSSDLVFSTLVSQVTKALSREHIAACRGLVALVGVDECDSGGCGVDAPNTVFVGGLCCCCC